MLFFLEDALDCDYAISEINDTVRCVSEGLEGFDLADWVVIVEENLVCPFKCDDSIFAYFIEREERYRVYSVKTVEFS